MQLNKSFGSVLREYFIQIIIHSIFAVLIWNIEYEGGFTNTLLYVAGATLMSTTPPLFFTSKNGVDRFATTPLNFIFTLVSLCAGIYLVFMPGWAYYILWEDSMGFWGWLVAVIQIFYALGLLTRVGSAIFGGIRPLIHNRNDYFTIGNGEIEWYDNDTQKFTIKVADIEGFHFRKDGSYEIEFLCDSKTSTDKDGSKMELDMESMGLEKFSAKIKASILANGVKEIEPELTEEKEDNSDSDESGNLTD